jgi:hypothetical protein
MTRTDLELCRKSKSTPPPSMEELGLHLIMLCSRKLKSSLNLRTLYNDMTMLTKR